MFHPVKKRPLWPCLCGFAALGLLVGCGGSNTVPGQTPLDAEQTDDSAHSGMSASAEIGALDEGEVSDGFRQALPEMQRCLSEGSKRIEFIGGAITFSIKINQDHKIVQAFAVDSTLGDRKTELCMFDALKHSSWPAPQGGVYGIAKNPFDFDAPNDVRAPVHWNESQVAAQRASLGGSISSCKHGSNGHFVATLYIDTDGNPISGSVTPPDEAGESSVDCLVGVLLGAHYDAPGSWPAKVTFEL
ncbi:MAG TPA: hypothetical protein VL137_15930 [Polyangiaceae bacterium]|nr:hypothetical protein [Polyangiaceae bacterium]